MNKHHTSKSHKATRIIAVMLACISVISATYITAFAEEATISEQQNTIYSTPTLENVGKIVDGGQIYVNGETNKLYRVFADDEEAINDIKAKVPNLLAILAEEYNLADLSNTNIS